MSGVRLLADDLTGALDSAVAFCGGRGAIPVLLDQQSGLDDAALDLACRDGGQVAAIAATRAASAFLAGADIAYLKIDSLLRGHWAAMLATLWQTGAFKRCVLAPAFPAQGRVTRRQRQFSRGLDGALHAVEADPAAALAAHGVSVTADATGVRFYDAETDDDLRRIVASARGLDGPTLWCGSAGLATALAAASMPQATRLVGPVLVVVGSIHPVSEAQVAHVHDATAEAPLLVGGEPSECASIAARLRDAGFCVIKAQIEPRSPPALAAEQIAAILHRLLPAMPAPGTLVVAGGETLRAACRAFGLRTPRRRGAGGDRDPRLAPMGRKLGGHAGGVEIRGVWIRRRADPPVAAAFADTCRGRHEICEPSFDLSRPDGICGPRHEPGRRDDGRPGRGRPGNHPEGRRAAARTHRRR